MNEQMTPDALASLLKREYDTADQYHDYLETLQRLAFEYYEAQPNGHEVEGRSQLVLPDVQEVVDDTTAALLRMFVSGERTVEFEAVDEADEQAADDATSAIEYNFMRKQDGYGVLNDIIQDGSLRKLGIFKAVTEEIEKVSRRWEVVPAEGLPLLMAEGNVEDVRLFEEADEMGNPVAMARVLIKDEKVERCYNLVAVPTAEFLFTPDARHEDLADYVAHAVPTSRSDLVSMGFDREQVYGLPAHTDEIDRESESDTLDQYSMNENSEALVKVLLCEEYARVDHDGDGIAERVKVYRVENEILRWQGEPVLDEMGEQVLDERGDPMFEEGELAVETVDEQPFAVYCPFPRPHRLIGYSLAEKIMDIQLARTQLLRQLMDGMMFSNLPRHEVVESGVGDSTYDDLLSPIPGGVVRVKNAGTVTPMQSNFNIGQSLQAIEWFSREKEARSGSGRSVPVAGQDSLNNQTATEFLGRESKSEALQEYMARNLAEAFARGCMKLYRLMRLEAEPFQIKVDGKYRTVDPSGWPEDMNMRVRVGLGSGSKDKRVAARMALQQPLIMSYEEGMSGPEHLFKWMDAMARDVQLGTGEDFMYDPEDPQVAERLAQKQAEPDPAIVEAQGKLELERAKATEQARLDRDKAAANIEAQREKHLLDMQVAREKAALEAELARDRTAAEIELARERMRAEVAMKDNMTDQRMGGSVAS